MDNTSLAYTEGRYADVFEAARSNRLRGDDVIEYSKSLEKLRDLKKGIQQATEEAREKAYGGGDTCSVNESGRLSANTYGRMVGLSQDGCRWNEYGNDIVFHRPFRI